ncbi:MAG: amidohydrolase family protein [Acidobacteria bacterium]|nr:amidohydrolase family protein [Acidobacteriota bacterium]
MRSRAVLALSLVIATTGCEIPERRTAVAAADAPPPEIAAQSTSTATVPGLVALVGGRLLDGYGGPPLDNSVLIVRDGRIETVGTLATTPVPAGAEVISTEGMTVMPGLIDMHVHMKLLGHGDYRRWNDLYADRMNELVMPIAASQLLSSGVTSARDLGAVPDEILELRRQIDAGEIPGPRMFVSGPFLQVAPYEDYEAPFRWGVSSEREARQTVQQLARQGVDTIKLIDQDQMEDAVVAAIVETAHAEGLPVVAHGHRMEEIRVGLRHGVDNFEHTGLGTAPGYPEDVLEGLRERNASLYWTPTVTPLLTMRYTGEIFPERLDDPRWRDGMPAEVADEIRGSLAQITHLPYYALFPSRIPKLRHKFNQLRDTGVTLMIGTDSGIPTMFHNDSTWREMALWVEFGVPAMQVIQAATLWPARFLGAEDDIGVLAEGRFADVIGVRGDPLTDMRVLAEVDLVVKGGVQVR